MSRSTLKIQVRSRYGVEVPLLRDANLCGGIDV
ncbi:MAG: hypothetical protein JWN70_4760, partial [Planctomycetaceae bacterium]|nr:hypothetical protein [Planctomycetaceae bacterium]